MDSETLPGSELVFDWSDWLPLEAVLRRDVPLTSEPGLYRIRRAGREDVDYIGQTGIGIARRIQMLRGVYGQEMPYSDPHTAGPALWAFRDSTACEFEVSMLPVDGPAQWRRGLEAVAIATYRQEHGCSPTCNFGRLPTGYSGSSGNNRRLVAQGKRMRGGRSSLSHARHLPGVPPAGTLDGDPVSPDWCGHTWSAWRPLRDWSHADGVGLYRIRGSLTVGLVYVGEGKLSGRLQTHWRTAAARASGDSAQHRAFASAGDLEYSYVAGPWLSHQRLELETDLIAAHILSVGLVPPAQFLGASVAGSLDTEALTPR